MLRLIYEVKAEGTERSFSDGPKNDFLTRVELDTTCFAGFGTLSQKRFDELIEKAEESSTCRRWL